MPEGNDLRLFVMLFAKDDDDLGRAVESPHDNPQSFLEGLKWEAIEELIMKDESSYPDVFIYRVLKYVPTYRTWVDRSECEAHAKHELLAEAWMDRHRQGNAPEAEGRAPDPTWDYFMYEVVDGKLVLVASTVAKV